MRQALIRLAKYLMLPAGAAYALFRPPGPVTILMYHRVNGAVARELSVTPADFRWQMEYLKRHGYTVVTLDEALDPRARPRGRRVVLTFDDGYEDFCEHAFPVLREYGYPSIVYVVPGYVGTGRVFRWDGDLGESKLMSWEQIGRLHQSGIVEFGSHTMTHADLDCVCARELNRELVSSRDALGRALNAPVRHFAYPRGIVTPEAAEAARAVYGTAVSIFDGCGIGAHRGFDPMRIKRAPVQRSDGRGLFAARLRGWLAPEGWLKRAMGRH